MPTSEHTTFDVAVIGAGLLGAATAWRLSQRKLKVAVLEQTTPANARGSSHGSARIFRYAYFDPFYAQMASQSRALWNELESAAGKVLIRETGCIDFGATAGVQELHRILKELDVESQLLTQEQTNTAYPQVSATSDVLFQAHAGVLDAETAVETLLAQATTANLLTGWEVSRVVRAENGFEVYSSSGAKIRARKVVVAAGGWVAPLLDKLPFSQDFRKSLPEFTVWQEQAFHFPYRTDYPADTWPTTIYRDHDVQVYSLPGGRDAGHSGQKIARFLGGKVIGSAAEQDGMISDENRQFMVEHVKRYFPGLVPEPYAETTCLFTSTPTEDFVIDEEDGLVLVSACSGHGAKTAPMTGEYAAHLITGKADIPRRLRPSLGGAPRTGRAQA